MDMSLSKLWETVKDREAWHTAVHGVTNNQTLLSNWTTKNSLTALVIRECRLKARASLVAQTVKHLPAMRETWVQSLGQEDPLQEGMAAHPSILAWRIPMDRGAWRAAAYSVAQSHTWLKQLSSSSRLKAQDITALLIEELKVKIDHTKCDQDAE